MHSLVFPVLFLGVLLTTAPFALANHEEENCELPLLDFAFVLDRSGSVGGANFDISLQFVQDAVNTLEDDELVNIWTFASSPQEEVEFTEASNLKNDPALISNIDYSGGGTTTSLALKEALSNIENYSTFNGDNGRDPVLFLVTDGKPNSGYHVCSGSNSLEYESGSGVTFKDKIDELNVTVIVIAVGAAINTHVACLLDSGSQYVAVNDFTNLEDLDLLSLLCSCDEGRDVSPPIFNCPTHTITLPADDACEASHTFQVTGLHDNCDASENITVSPDPATFNFNKNSEFYKSVSATDSQENDFFCVLKYEVVDVTPPSFTCPPPSVLEL
eukprot:Awhi_evm1s93